MTVLLGKFPRALCVRCTDERVKLRQEIVRLERRRAKYLPVNTAKIDAIKLKLEECPICGGTA